MKKLTSLLLALIMLFTVLTLSGCGIKPLKNGFSKYGDIIPDYFIAYKSDVSKFDLSDVSLEFYYGVLEYERLVGKASISSFEICFLSGDSDLYIAKKITDELVSEEYNVDIAKVPFLARFFIDNLTFSHSETIAIPEFLFDKNTGEIRIVLCSEFLYSEHNNSEFLVECSACSAQYTTHILAESVLYYQKNDDRIILSSEPF